MSILRCDSISKTLSRTKSQITLPSIMLLHVLLGECSHFLTVGIYFLLRPRITYLGLKFKTTSYFTDLTVLKH